MHADFQIHGVEVIERVRKEDPVAYLKTMVNLTPKESITRLESGAGNHAIVINLLGVRHPLIEEKDITPSEDS
jgi:hypothetical protein